MTEVKGASLIHVWQSTVPAVHHFAPFGVQMNFARCQNNSKLIQNNSASFLYPRHKIDSGTSPTIYCLSHPFSEMHHSLQAIQISLTFFFTVHLAPQLSDSTFEGTIYERDFEILQIKSHTMNHLRCT